MTLDVLRGRDKVEESLKLILFRPVDYLEEQILCRSKKKVKVMVKTEREIH